MKNDTKTQIVIEMSNLDNSNRLTKFLKEISEIAGYGGNLLLKVNNQYDKLVEYDIGHDVLMSVSEHIETPVMSPWETVEDIPIKAWGAWLRKPDKSIVIFTPKEVLEADNKTTIDLSDFEWLENEYNPTQMKYWKPCQKEVKRIFIERNQK